MSATILPHVSPTSRVVITSNPSALPVVHIATANTCLCNMHTNIPRIFERWNRAILEDDVLDGA